MCRRVVNCTAFLIQNCKEKLALEHILGNNLKQQNMSLDEFITMRDSMENENSNSVENTITINNITTSYSKKYKHHIIIS